MQLGYELVKEQLFFRKELMERVSWFIRLRWIAVGVALLASWAAYFFLERKFPILPINIILFFIILYNIIFLIIWSRLKSFKPPEVRLFGIFAHTQISLDLLALYLAIYFTGGIYSPVLIFVIFHIILTGILLSPVSCFVYGILVLLAQGGLIVLQKSTIFPIQPVLFKNPLFHYSIEYPGILVPYLTFTAAILITAFLTTSLKLSLRTKGRELLRVSRELDISNEKLTALYEMVKEMGFHSDLRKLMDSATKNAAKIMGVKGCSIKLLDDQRERLIFASTHGLSEDYVKAKEGIDIKKSPINRKIIEGSYHAIGKIDEKDYFQYPEDIYKEGIDSMMCLPLRVEKMVLGVFCVYSGVSYYFTDSDVKFFSLMADLTALSIESLKRELNKTWFLKKAAHQLRSPMNTIYSMLNLLRGRYLGSINPEQENIINRCSKRIDILGDVINDLLKLGIERSDMKMTTPYPVNIKNILNRLIGPYKILALEKKVDLMFDIDDSIPEIMANEQLIDELFTNLISNAVKYTPPGGKVVVALAREGDDRVRFEVLDTGIGIPGEDIPRLFTEFFRTENAKAYVEEGTGLGLVIVKEILDRLKGTVEVKSTVGQGTRFTCHLPSI
ncbi:MAG: GAF domain-containing protein [Desulfobacteraceae bacterium]|nr:GAF domain-containing protein [Desulfobacteraceae bacterium]